MLLLPTEFFTTRAERDRFHEGISGIRRYRKWKLWELAILRENPYEECVKLLPNIPPAKIKARQLVLLEREKKSK